MPLEPTFSLTPADPKSIKWNSTTAGWEHYATLECCGIYLGPYPPYRLGDQLTQDKAVLWHSGLERPAPTTLPTDWTAYSISCLRFVTNATTENQYLLIFHVSGYADAGFYIDGSLVRVETVSGDEYIAILVDSPSSQTWMYVYMALVGNGRLELKGIECYVL